MLKDGFEFFYGFLIFLDVLAVVVMFYMFAFYLKDKFKNKKKP